MRAPKRTQHGLSQVMVLAVTAAILAVAYVALDFYSDGLKNVVITESRGANIISGLTKHRLELGGYPDTLDKLVPKYLGSVLKCPNGEPFAYQLSGGEYSLICQNVTFKSRPYNYSSRTRAWGG
jgi:hypothetical protein